MTAAWLGFSSRSCLLPRRPLRLPGQTSGCFRIPFWLSEGGPVAQPDLQVKVNGQSVKASRFLGAKEDLLLLLVLDWSGDLSLVDPARNALIDAIGNLPPNVHVGLLRAQEGLKVMLDPGADRTRLVEAIRGLTVSGHAGLLNAIEPMQQLGDSIAAKLGCVWRLLYVSDSNITNYREDYTNPVVNSSDAGDMSREVSRRVGA